MRETNDNRMTKTQWKAPHYCAGAGLLFVGLLAGRAFFPLEIPKPFVIEKEKRVEVPVEVVKYVDRVVEKRVEVPVEKLAYIDKIASTSASRPTGGDAWMQLTKGLSRSAVLAILGEPRKIDGGYVFEDWYYGARGEARVSFMNGEVYTWVSP